MKTIVSTLLALSVLAGIAAAPASAAVDAKTFCEQQSASPTEPPVGVRLKGPRASARGPLIVVGRDNAATSHA